MTDDFVWRLRRDVGLAFGEARQIAVLANRGGMLVLVGHPTGAEITGAAMLLASLSMRLPSAHAYVAPGIPAATLLRRLERTDRGSIVAAPVLDRGVPEGAVVVEARRGHAFSRDDLARLEATVAQCGRP